MSETTLSAQPTTFKIGYALLLFVTVSNVLGHIGLMLFDPGNDVIFLSWASFNFMASAILIFAYRQRQSWAWYIICALVIPYALIILFNAEIGPIYLGEASLLIIGQLLTYRSFFANGPNG